MIQQQHGITPPRPRQHGDLRTAPTRVLPCVNLAERFGKRFKVRFEESYAAERPAFRAVEAPWLMVIPCVGGEIYPQGGPRLAAFLRRGPRAEVLKRLACVQVKTLGDDGVTVTFDAADFDQVAAIMQPRRRRQLSEERRRACAEVLARVRPQPLPQSNSDERPCVQVAYLDPKAVAAGSAILDASGVCESLSPLIHEGAGR